jgi:hypothetical protein
MAKILDILVRELNPVHDLDRSTYYNPELVPGLWKGFANQALHLSYYILNNVKSMLRGSLVGSVVGLAVGSTFGHPVEGMEHGAALGMVADMCQYSVRSLADYISQTVQYEKNKKSEIKTGEQDGNIKN